MSKFMQNIIDLIDENNYEDIKDKINKEKRLIIYQTVLSICLHIINALSIILSVISETIQIKIIYAVMFCNISNSILNYKILKSHSNIQANNKIINQYLKQQNIETPYVVEDNYVGIKKSNTPTNTSMITVKCLKQF